jgi:hypothetical protein
MIKAAQDAVLKAKQAHEDVLRRVLYTPLNGTYRK